MQCLGQQLFFYRKCLINFGFIFYRGLFSGMSAMLKCRKLVLCIEIILVSQSLDLRIGNIIFLTDLNSYLSVLSKHFRRNVRAPGLKNTKFKFSGFPKVYVYVYETGKNGWFWKNTNFGFKNLQNIFAYSLFQNIQSTFFSEKKNCII